jgi:hypothetical protein
MSFPYRLPCLYPGCPLTFKSQHGRTYHIRNAHINPNAQSELNLGLDSSESTPNLTQQPNQRRGRRIEHPYLTGKSLLYNQVYMYILTFSQQGLPCDANGRFLLPGTQPTPRVNVTRDDWSPFENKVQFLVADLLYRRVEMSASNVNTLMELWETSMDDLGVSGPFQTHQHMHAVIDSVSLGDAPWQCLKTGFSEDVSRDAPTWKQTAYRVWYRDPNEVIRLMLDNPDFSRQFDVCPYVELDMNDKRRWTNVMSANIAWNHCVSTHFIAHTIY